MRTNVAVRSTMPVTDGARLKSMATLVAPPTKTGPLTSSWLQVKFYRTGVPPRPTTSHTDSESTSYGLDNRCGVMESKLIESP